ncbi:MAG: hypothetical protein IPP72_15325 [Chitinophagaceae bacterium]|nr:hypothetical protein [Chitinophagaceae bacterium]
MSGINLLPPLHNYKVTVTGTTADRNLFLTVYAGNCDALNQIVCINDYRPAVLGAADEEAVSLDNLTIGNTYYVRVYNQAFTNEGADFTICVSDVDPLNDLCSNAITVPVNSGDNCTQTVTGSNMTATRSYDAPYLNNPIVTCPENASADVFYKFIATAASLKIKQPNRKRRHR